MNPYLKTIEDFLLRHNELTPGSKEALLKAIADADKQWTITEFKLDRTEKVKKTTAVLLEQTIEELEQKRKAVEAQNRELEIETALERVRSVAMGMKEPADMLDVCKTISRQLESLQVKEIRNVQTAVFDESKGIYTNYEFYAKHDKLFITETEFRNHPIAETFANQMLKGPNEVFIHGFKGDEVKDWLNYQKSTNVFIDTYLETADSLIYYWYSLGPVALGISTYAPLNEDEINLFKRFRNVFELAYRRYIDIEQAQAQARESQIQLALERVRARTMAMQKSDELSEAVYILFQQFRELGENPDQATIGVINEKEHVIEYWVTMYGNQMNKEFKFSIDEPHVTNKIYNAWKEGRKSLVIDLSGEALLEFMVYRAGKGGAAVNPNEKRRIINIAFFSKGLLNVQSNEQRSEESIKLLERFAAVFEQTYTRFLDLQKAEAQAREAQIELALERVRAKTMAMQKSDELQEVVDTVFDRLMDLNVELYTAIIIIFAEGSKDIVWWMQNKVNQQYSKIFIRYVDIAYLRRLFEAREKGEEIFSKCYINGEKNELYDYLFEHTDLKQVPAEQKKFLQENEFAAISVALARNIGIHITSYSKKSFSQEENEILRRFAKVFDQAYTRFLDLKNAEALTREAQIELGLERVRARAMAMQKSDELKELIGTVFIELTKLDLVLTRCLIMIYDPKSNDSVWWMANSEAPSDPIGLYVKNHEQPPYLAYIKAWEERNVKWQYILQGKVKKDWDDFLFVETELSHLPDFVIAGMKAPDKVYLNASFNSFGNLTLASLEPLSNEHFEIMLRFAKVFDLTYTRFNDLKQAEAQAREARIEASLEKVRSSAMSMHTSNDISATTSVIFAELERLGIESIRCGVALLSKSSRRAEVYAAATSSDGQVKTLRRAIEMTDHPSQAQQYESWLSQKNYVVELEGEELKSYYHLPFFYSSPSYVPPQDYGHSEFGYYIPFSEGLFYAWTKRAYSERELNILNRFKGIIDLTFRRFLDLQKAEAQAREAKIEAALEKVRARTMAMQHSDELSETASVLFEQLKQLGEAPERTFIGVVNEEEHVIEIWATQHGGTQMDMIVNATIDEPTVMNRMYVGWKAQKKSIVIDLQGEELESYFQFLKGMNAPVSREIFGERRLENIAFFSKGMLGVITHDPRTPEAIQLYERFAGVFDLTYTRFLDLQKAEAQTREATIEAALEKVRGRAMAMHNSNDLSSAASLVFTELRKLGISPIRCGVGLLNKESRKAQLYSASSSAEGDNLSLVGWVMLSGHPVLEKIYDTWLKNEEYYPELSGEQLRSYYELLLKGLPVTVPAMQDEQKQYGTFLPFTIGCLYAWSETPYNDTETKILKRFAAIIDLTFRRYIELQKSEANAREAVKQAALDRVRAEIASMRTVADLEKITPLIWNELTILGIPFIRCGVFIMDESQRLIHTFLSTPEGKAIAAFHIPYDTPGNISQVLGHWQQKKSYIDRWDENAFTEFAGTLVKQGALVSSAQYLQTIPQGGFHLHFLPFLQGMLYVGNTSPLSEDEIRLIQSVADAFSTAYARYEDFNKLEAAKQQVEKTLVDLKQTQQQLVQSEKMASLGELTAGIAHEIQNPLNFVNNFSEVSNELIEEMKDELEKGNKEDAIAIAEDVKQNLEKINFHGKRADAIVKGMLQHSRASSGQKEMTDLNMLADEYLRLAYHGLRAKDKSFNARFKTDFDKTIGKISLLPQDIGRVILNLINNAFYAVSEKRKQNLPGYEPTVTVTTKKLSDKVELRVVDNGDGIPQKVLDKIFQPFFTTKPTGQGTGLGLSLSYDIVTKGHGGELRVETKEGEGTTFIIQLPVHSTA